jgi:hypothetical protein
MLECPHRTSKGSHRVHQVSCMKTCTISQVKKKPISNTGADGTTDAQQDYQEANMKAFTITASNANRLELARWLRSIRTDLTVPRALQEADDLLAGEDLEFYLYGHQVIAAPDGVKLVPVVYDNPYAAHFKEQAGYYALRDKGAAGDVDAAIAYCKLELEGKVSHGAMG